ncbi:MAG: GDP-mannose 4,6-dehydratase, partial [Alphaproteobacteria bacterium]|nr:GDP-mannose 4,6-dehydratase [Alphaproteobacteria bacterium]
GVTIEWRGSGEEEKGYDSADGMLRVEVDPGYFRPTEVDLSIGDATKARDKLGWEPKRGFSDMVAEMVASDLEAVREERQRRDRHG